MAGNYGQYQVRLKDQDGNVVAIFNDFQYLEYQLNLNAPGWHEIRLLSGDPAVSAFEVDGQVEVWRRPPGADWQLDYEGLHLRNRWWTDESGRDYFSSVGRTYEEFLNRRITLPPEGLYGRFDYDEYGPDFLTNIMREMVYSHCGMGASADRRIPGLSVEADDDTGPTVTVKFRYQILLSALQRLADMGADFAIVGTGDATWEFRAYYPRRGEDRTLSNTEGNDPVVFSVQRANMVSPRVIESWLDVVNAVYVGGAGSGDERTVVERTDATSLALSPYFRRERFYDRRQYNDESILADLGDAYLAKRAHSLEFEFRSKETEYCRYGVHWNLGDLVTAKYSDWTFDLKVAKVHVTVSRTGLEIITPTFQLE